MEQLVEDSSGSPWTWVIQEKTWGNIWLGTTLCWPRVNRQNDLSSLFQIFFLWLHRMPWWGQWDLGLLKEAKSNITTHRMTTEVSMRNGHLPCQQVCIPSNPLKFSLLLMTPVKNWKNSHATSLKITCNTRDIGVTLLNHTSQPITFTEYHLL